MKLFIKIYLFVLSFLSVFSVSYDFVFAEELISYQPKIISLSDAFLLDKDKEILDDVYDDIRLQDNNWISISNGQYIRAVFERTLTNKNDITLYARPTGSTPVIIEAYTVDTNQLVAVFNIDHEGLYKKNIYDLNNPTSVFDLKIIGEAEVDWVIDPTGDYAINIDDFEYINIGNPSSLQLQNFTITTWVKYEGSGYNFIFSHAPIGSSGWGLSYTGTVLYFDDAWVSTVLTYNTTLLNDGNYHQVGIYRGSDYSVGIILDGQIVATGYYYNTFGFGDFFIGSRGGENLWIGKIDEFNIWNRALSSSEISTLYNSGAGLYGDTNISPFNNGLVAGYHFDEGSGSTALDFSSSGNNGTTYGTTYVDGKIISPSSRYWVGSSSSWNNSNNWSHTSGGINGASVPDLNNEVFFDSANTTDCDIDINVNVPSITISSGYTGTITQTSSNSITVDSITQNGGVFDGGTSNIVSTGDFTINSGVFNSTSGNLSVSGDFINSGTFNPNGGNIILKGIDKTLSVGGAEFDNLSLNGETVGGGVLRFDGTNDYVSLNNYLITTGNENISVSAWVYLYALSGSITRVVYGEGLSTGSSPYMMLIIKDNKFGVWQISGNSVTYGSSIIANKWYHVVWNRINSNQFELWVNGVKITTANYNYWFNNTAGDNHTIGVMRRNDLFGPFSGLIDEVNIWNRALSSSEISTLYNSGAGLYGDTNISPFNNGLVAGYHFDEGSGSTALDFSSSGNNGVLINSPTWTTDEIALAHYNSSISLLDDLSVSDNLTIGSGNTLSALTHSIDIGGNFNNAGIFDAGTGGVVLSSGSHTVTGTTTFNNLTFSPSNTITLPSNIIQTIEGTLSCVGTPGNTIVINSSASGTSAILSKETGVVSCDYLSLKDSEVTGGASWYAGGNSVNVSGNIGWIFGTVVSDISKMFSVNYIMDTDSINFAGTDNSLAGNFVLSDSLGEVGTGYSSSTNYSMSAGYRNLTGSYISISTSEDVVLPSMSGLISGESNSSESWVVITDNSAGYEMLIKASTSPALKTVSGAFFSDYITSVSDVPDYVFSVANESSTFSFSPEGQDISQKYLDDGSSCGTGSYDTENRCWDGLSTTEKVIVHRTSSNHPDGTITTIKYKTAIGNNKIQDAGTYISVIILTAVVL